VDLSNRQNASASSNEANSKPCNSKDKEGKNKQSTKSDKSGKKGKDGKRSKSNKEERSFSFKIVFNLSKYQDIPETNRLIVYMIYFWVGFSSNFNLILEKKYSL
jgi:hypothetical protein